ncbi:MAG: CDP-6-deoxy-delta-3,4-glucoseen reductase [Pigmentiphaga sp.]|nr:CDP-6-deoxy-delta-3,4-glucoseen reductase [Pigmentiphaga sp.]
MSHRITVQPSGRQFFAAPGQTILEAALAAGVTLPYSCKSGACSSCKGRVVGGDIHQGPHQPGTLTADEARAGYALFCCATPQSDLTVQARVVQGIDGIEVRKIPVRVHRIEHLADDVILLTLQLPANQRIRFNAGQYLEFVLKNGLRRSYSMATAPHEPGFVDLHIRHMPGGVFTDALFGITEPAIKVRDILRCEMPLGSFFLREDSERPIVLVASGTGFAPVKAMVEHLEHAQLRRSVHLYWGGRRPRDLYLDPLARDWAARLPGFTYVPVISDALPEDGWTGRTGWVHRAVMHDFPNLSGHQVYACGAPAMVAAARHDFIAHCGLPEEEFFADAFTSEADLATAVE